MGKLVISDAMIIKAEYEFDLFQPDDCAYDIVEVIILDECYDQYTKGFLMAKLEEWAESLDGKHLLEQFIEFIKIVKS